MCPVCRMMLYCFCFVACVVWVTEGQLKKRVGVIWALRNTVGRGGLDSCGGV